MLKELSTAAFSRRTIRWKSNTRREAEALSQGRRMDSEAGDEELGEKGQTETVGIESGLVRWGVSREAESKDWTASRRVVGSAG